MEAIINGKSLPISPKHSYEVCNFIRNKELELAKKMLTRVMEKKIAVPYKRYNTDTAHKPGMAAGQYPIKTCKAILDLLSGVQANAQNKGMSSKLIIEHISSHKAPRQWHASSKRRRKMKTCHIKIVVKELKK